MSRKFLVPGVGLFDLTDDQLLRIVDHQRAVENQTSLAMRVLFRCCEQRNYRSSVLLAIEESDSIGKDVSPEVIQWALEELNEKDYVVYTLGDHGVFTNIRPTKHGYTAAGYPPPMPVVGQRGRSYVDDSPRHPGDRTDFRTHGFYASGGPVDKEDIYDHLAKFPDHRSIHDIEGVDQIMANPAVQQIMREQGVSQRTAYKMLRKAEAEKYGNDVKPNHKVVALEALNLLPNRGNSVAELRTKMAELGLVADAHTLTHILWSLQKEQLVKFRERKNSSHDTESMLDGIRLLPRGVAKLQENRAKGLSNLTTEIVGRPPARRDRPEGPRAPKYIKELGRNGVELTPIEVPVIDEGEPTEVGSDTAEAQTQADAKEVSPDTHTEYPADRPHGLPPRDRTFDMPSGEWGSLDEGLSVTKIAFEMDDFPLISALMARGAKVQQAAELLMEAGQDDLAMQALDSVKYTPFEDEVMRFVKTLG